jgi:hypothetical protein
VRVEFRRALGVTPCSKPCTHLAHSRGRMRRLVFTLFTLVAPPAFANPVSGGAQQAQLLNPYDARPLEPVSDPYVSIDVVSLKATLLYFGVAPGRAW